MAECLVIGGGPAGLTAATYLGRFRRSTVLVDAGNSRAAAIPAAHNHPALREVSGSDLLERLRGQAQVYSVKLTTGTVEALDRDGDGFVARISGDECIRAQRVLLASGIEDRAPELPGLDQAVSCSVVRYCPICDGYEALGKRIAVFGELDHALREAEFLRTYSKSVTVFYGAADGVRTHEAPARFGIVIAPAATRWLRCSEFGVKAELANDDVLAFDVLYPALGCAVRSGLARTLGARVDRAGCVRVDQQQRTSVEGPYAAGDVVSDLHQISVAEGHAAIAATAMHNSLPRNFL